MFCCLQQTWSFLPQRYDKCASLKCPFTDITMCPRPSSSYASVSSCALCVIAGYVNHPLVLPADMLNLPWRTTSPLVIMADVLNLPFSISNQLWRLTPSGLILTHRVTSVKFRHKTCLSSGNDLWPLVSHGTQNTISWVKAVCANGLSDDR